MRTESKRGEKKKRKETGVVKGRVDVEELLGRMLLWKKKTWNLEGRYELFYGYENP